MVIIGVLLIVAVLLDAWRRIRNDKRSRVKVDLVDPQKLGSDRDDDLAWLKELPNGGARVVQRGDLLRATREAQARWQAEVNRFLSERAALTAVVLVMDIRHPLTEGDVQMIEWAQAAGRRVHVLLTKADKLSRGKARATELTVQRELGENASAQCFSAMTGTGLDAARQRVTEWLAVEVGGEVGGAVGGEIPPE